jgi:hypothetical protein
MTNQDYMDSTVIKADGFVAHALRWTWRSLLEGAAAYGAALQGYPSQDQGPAPSGGQSMSKFRSGD